MYRDKRECVLKSHVYVQILIIDTSNIIKEFNFLEKCGDSREINLSEKCVDISCIKFIFDMSKI